MMNCMGQGFAATEVGGIRIADWALAIAYILLGLLLVIALVALVRTVMGLWRGRSVERQSVPPMDPPRPSEGGAA